MGFYHAKNSKIFMDQKKEDTANCKQESDAKCEYQIFFHEKEHELIGLRPAGLKYIEGEKSIQDTEDHDRARYIQEMSFVSVHIIIHEFVGTAGSRSASHERITAQGRGRLFSSVFELALVHPLALVWR